MHEEGFRDMVHLTVDILLGILDTDSVHKGGSLTSFFLRPTKERWREMRSLVLLETTIAATLLVASGLTLAHHLLNTVYCPTSGWCEATDESEHIYGTDAKESIFAGDGEDQVDAFAGDDTVYDGGYGDDALYGGEGWDSLYGALGDDKLFGASGQDDLYGDDGNDYLHGGSERDFIEGYFGQDHIRGGGGSDEIYTGRIPRRGIAGPDGLVDTVECGSGFDTVYYEKDRDSINSDCEKKKPYSY
jgi:Ca2+-binding RTX toxin-like protein